GTSGIEVKARGLYFQYNGKNLPKPIFDKVKLDRPSLRDLALNGLKTLGAYLPDTGLPIGIKDVQATDFGPDGKGGGISFTVLVSLPLGNVGFDKLPQLKGKVAVFPNGKVDLGEIGVKIALAQPIPSDSHGVLIESVQGTLRPKDKTKTVSLGLTLVTAAGKGSTLTAEITASFGFPISRTGISYEGKLKLNKMDLGQIDGLISKEKLTM